MSKPLRPICLSEEEEGKAEETRKEEVEPKIEVEGTAQQMHKEEAAIQIRTKVKAAANKENSFMLKDKGMINLMFNAIIAKSMDIMLVIVERNNMIRTADKMQMLQEKTAVKKMSC